MKGLYMREITKTKKNNRTVSKTNKECQFAFDLKRKIADMF